MMTILLPRYREDIPDFLNAMNLHGIGAEVGVCDGGFSTILLSWQSKQLWLIDCWQETNGFDKNNQQHIQSLNNTISAVSSAWGRARLLQAFSEEAASFFQDASFDFVYIDALHDYINCKRDIELWYPKVKPFGVIAGHDYWNASVDGTQCLHICGVKKAVDEFFKETVFFTQETTISPSWLVIKGYP